MYFGSYKAYAKGRIRKDNTMNGSEIILVLFIARIIIPFGMLLALGEWVRHHDANYWLKM